MEKYIFALNFTHKIVALGLAMEKYILH